MFGGGGGGGEETTLPPIPPPILGQIRRPMAQGRSTICKLIASYRCPGDRTGCGLMGGGVSTIPPSSGRLLVVLRKLQDLANDN